MKHILKCSKCGVYSLSEKCKCGGIAVTVKPQKYSPDDRYAEYRREAKKPIREKEGLI